MSSHQFGAWVAAAAVVGGAAGVLAQPEEREHARARLICESTTLVPGTTAWLALDFEIDEHWHLYWNGVNDSGFAPKLNPAFPEGFKAGEITWPAPKRLVQAGDILDHVYEGQVTLMFPVEVPKEAKAGSEVEFKASPEWLVCHEVCLPGSAEVALKMKVAAPGQKPEAGPQASFFAKARERHPVKPPKAKEGTPPPFTTSMTGDKVSIQVAGAKEVAFYPGLDGVGLPALIKEGSSKTGTLTLSIKREDGKPARLMGVLEAKPEGGGRPNIWAVDVDLENKANPGSSNQDPRTRGD